jgi:hypothetical protein
MAPAITLKRAKICFQTVKLSLQPRQPRQADRLLATDNLEPRKLNKKSPTARRVLWGKGFVSFA